MKRVVVPKEGLNVFNPQTEKNLPAEGARVVVDRYFERRKAQKEVVILSVDDTEKWVNEQAEAKKKADAKKQADAKKAEAPKTEGGK